MFPKRTKRLVEVCPQCRKSTHIADHRLVQDTCGHSKCRICLIQEIKGCLLCAAEERVETAVVSEIPKDVQPRKSVITSVAKQIAEQKQCDEKSIALISPPDKDTCHVIKQSLEKDILFPTDIVKRSSGNFYHLKRVFSERFFNEGKNKEHKACETDEKWIIKNDETEEIDDDTTTDLKLKPSLKIPSHIKVQYYCTIHNKTIDKKDIVIKQHMTCSSETDEKTSTIKELLSCNECDRSFKLVSKLNRHMKIHTKKSKFKCTTCEKVFKDNYALKTHERIHTQSKPYVCRYCDKKFSGVNNFKRHEKRHRDEKNFICNDCGFRFLTNLELKRHSVIHSNIKPFVCAVCLSKFSLKRTLVRHMRTHDTNPVTIECQYCDSTFKRKDNLDRHVKNVHLEQSYQAAAVSEGT